MSIFDRFYERPSFDFSRIGSSPEPSNQPMQSFNENEEDMEAEALLDQFLADGVITDEERSILGGLGLSGAAFAAQTGRAPTPRPIVPSKSELAQRIAANDAAREAASKAAPRAASRSASRASAAASRAASRAAPRAASTATRLARVGGPGALLFGAADLGTELVTGKSISERIGETLGEAVGNLLFPGAMNLPALTEEDDVGSKRSRNREGGQNALRDFISDFEFEGRRGKRSTPSASQFMDPDPIGQIPLENAFSAESAEQVNPMLREFSQQELDDATAALPVGVQRGSPQANFIETFAESGGNLTDEQIAQFRREARDMGTTFNPETGFSRDPFLSAQASRTSTPLPGQTLSQFLRYEDSPEQRTEQFVDAQGRLRNRFTPEAAELQGLADFVQPSLDEREMRLAERDRRPGETQTQRDTRIAQSRTTGAQTADLSFDEARRRAEGELARRGVRNPSVSQVNALAQLLQDAESERLEDREARLNFEPKVVEIEGQKLIQLAPEYYQPVRPEPKEDEPFEPRILENNGFIYFERKPNEFQIQPSTGQTTADIIAIINEERKKEGLTPIEAPTSIETPTTTEGDSKVNKKLDKETARSILNEAGGNAELARQIARERGFVL